MTTSFIAVWLAYTAYAVQRNLRPPLRVRNGAAFLTPGEQQRRLLLRKAGHALQFILTLLALWWAFRTGLFTRTLWSPVDIIAGLVLGHLLFGLSLLITHQHIGDVARHLLDIRDFCAFLCLSLYRPPAAKDARMRPARETPPRRRRKDTAANSVQGTRRISLSIPTPMRRCCLADPLWQPFPATHQRIPRLHKPKRRFVQPAPPVQNTGTRRPPSLFLLFVSVAVFEELTYRATAQEILASTLGAPIPAILITAILFCVIHHHFFRRGAVCALEFFFFSTTIGVVYYCTHSLTIVVLAHLVRNLESTYLEYCGLLMKHCTPVEALRILSRRHASSALESS